MIFILFIVVFAVLAFYRKRLQFNRLMTALWAVIFLLCLYFFANAVFPGRHFVYVNNEKANFIEYNGVSKYEKALKRFYSVNPIIISDFNLPLNAFLINEEDRTFGYEKLNDIGIDTSISSDGMLTVSIKQYSGNFIPSTLMVFLRDSSLSFELLTDTSINIPDTLIDSAVLLSDDDNEFNDKYVKSSERTVLVLTDKYSTSIQRLTQSLSSMFDSCRFVSGIKRGGKIISLKGKFDGMILLGESDSITSTVSYVYFTEQELNSMNWKSADELLKEISQQNVRIKNPFNPDKRIRENLYSKFISSIKANILPSAVFTLLSLSVILLF